MEPAIQRLWKPYLGNISGQSLIAPCHQSLQPVQGVQNQINPEKGYFRDLPKKSCCFFEERSEYLAQPSLKKSIQPIWGNVWFPRFQIFGDNLFTFTQQVKGKKGCNQPTSCRVSSK
jgi:hypothetical protein